jgi:serine/threonine protein kinase
MGAVCGKEERSLKQNSLQEGLELPGQQLNSGETAPGDHAGGFETAPGLLGLQNDDEMSDKDKDKGANTLMESPLAKGSIDPTYFSADELAYYEKEKRKEFGNDFLLKPQRSKIVWKQGDHIGSGSYGEVMMGLDQVTGTLMAVKKVRIEEMSGRNKSKIEALEQEISMYERLSHRNIVGYLGYEKTKNYFNIFLEYVEGKSCS